MRFPRSGDAWQVSTDGGTEPAWGPGGKEIFYRSKDTMMRVAVETEPTFAPGRPAALFDMRSMASGGLDRNYDLSPDGKRFVMVDTGESQPSPAQINLVFNWFEELKRRVPTR